MPSSDYDGDELGAQINDPEEDIEDTIEELLQVDVMDNYEEPFANFLFRLQEDGAGGVPEGAIIMWSGDPNDGIPDGWALCDGDNGTPDLRDRFIVGSGGDYAVGETGGEDEVSLSSNEMASHSHNVGGNTNNTGSHSHNFNTNTGNDGSHSHNFNTNTGNDGNHSHNYSRGTSNTSWYAANNALANGTSPYTVPNTVSNSTTNTGNSGSHSHNFNANTNSSGSHSHNFNANTNSSGSHSHNVNGNTSTVGDGEPHENRPPYYALAYIMKIDE